jgi:hypothetical protein
MAVRTKTDCSGVKLVRLAYHSGASVLPGRKRNALR